MRSPHDHSISLDLCSVLPDPIIDLGHFDCILPDSSRALEERESQYRAMLRREKLGVCDFHFARSVHSISYWPLQLLSNTEKQILAQVREELKARKQKECVIM